MESLEVQQTSIYNGVSSRSRGWKTRKPQKIPQVRSANPTVMKWDGTSKSSEMWDSLRRDPELWFRDGDCYVHLHEGQSRRGAAFRVPYSMLIEANYQPLINNFISRSRTDVASYVENPARHQIDLFIPAPPESDKRHSYNYHLTTRNLFAFIFRRSMVGECLGSALIALYNSLHQFRAPDADNLQDLMSYMDEEGYLDLNGQPTYALAMLHLAEAFQLRGLYIDAFAHCCGMGDQIFRVPEYQLLSSATRTSIRRARREMYYRLEKVTTTLKTFLRDELCEIVIELHPGGREHLERFRALLRGVYITHSGYPSIDAQTAIFETDFFRTMRNDFEALCEFLEDKSFDIFQSSDLLTESHILTFGSIKSFDTQYNHETLFHPLPLLPDMPQRKSYFWKMPWWNRPTKTSQSRQTDTLAALARATNSDRPEVVENHLVAAYRKFEEDQITSPTKADEPNNPEPISGRKIRWILIYAIHQTLRRATEVALEVRDATGVPYHLCISTVDLPPWKEEQSVHALVHAQLDRALLSSPTSGAKSDNDYSSLANQATMSTKERPRSNIFENFMPRGYSALRRSFSLRTTQGTERPRSEVLMPCRETVARGNENKMNTAAKNKELAAEIQSMDLARPLSNRLIRSSASGISNSSCHYSNSEAKTWDTSNTSVTGSPAQSRVDKWKNELASIYMRCSLHEVDRDTVRLGDERPFALSRKRPMSAQGDARNALELAPLHIRNAKKRPTSELIQMPSPQPPTAWGYIQAVMEVQANNYELAGWDQFTHLRDFIEVGSETPTARRASTIF